MTRLLHLTDLHFGLHRAELVQPLCDAILANRPDVVVVSGDLTQRALAGQFRAAMAFLRGLGIAFMVIPGNHDLPVFNPLARLLNPFGAYRRGAAQDLTPVLHVGRLRLFGVNTADPLRWRGGVARRAEVDRVCRAMREGPQDVTNVLVCHHPFEEPPGFERGETDGARVATEQLTAAGLHVILSGHLHHWTVGLGIVDPSISDTPGRPIFQIQTGTALCSRTGERDHGFSVMDFDGFALSVTPWIIDEAQGSFVPQARSAFVYLDGIWYERG